MSEYSEKCKRTPTADGVVPCYMCPGECVGDPATPEEDDRLCREWVERMEAKEAHAANPLRYEHHVYEIGGEWRGQGYYFSDETWSTLHGPYKSLWDAKVALTGYLFHLDFGPFSWRSAWKNRKAMYRSARWVAALPDPTKPDPKEWAI